MYLDLTYGCTMISHDRYKLVKRLMASWPNVNEHRANWNYFLKSKVNQKIVKWQTQRELVCNKTTVVVNKIILFTLVEQGLIV